VPPTSQEAFMLYVGLDVSMRRTAVCVLDAMGKVMREASVETAPETIAAAIRSAGGEVERVGLEAGMGSSWLRDPRGSSSRPRTRPAHSGPDSATRPIATTPVALQT
jgi:predicted NBD/HSP70 family sugar kinase